jgi:hypothetical protein
MANSEPPSARGPVEAGLAVAGVAALDLLSTGHRLARQRLPVATGTESFAVFQGGVDARMGLELRLLERPGRVTTLEIPLGLGRRIQ